METPTLFKVDSSKCLKCGACVRDCAFKALAFGEGSIPVLAHPSRCMRCQHCFAVCPAGAVEFDSNAAGDVPEVEGAELPSAESVGNWMRMRRSYRKFAKEDVDAELLGKVLETLANTPTGCNARNLTFTCFPTRDSVAKFKKAFISAIEEHRDGSKMLPRWLAVPAIRLREGAEDMFFRDASGILIVSSDETAPGVTTPAEDVVIACSNFELIAQANGIATCWCGFLKLVQNEVPELLEKAIGLRRTSPFYAMLFGKAAIGYRRAVSRVKYAEIVYR